MLKEELQNTKEELERRNTENFQLQNHIQEGSAHQDTFQQVQNEADVGSNSNFGADNSANQNHRSPQMSYQSPRNGDLHYSTQGSYPRFGQQPMHGNNGAKNWYGSQHDPGGGGRPPFFQQSGMNELQAVDNERNSYAGHYGVDNASVMYQM